MASQFYNRYIPPASVNGDAEEIHRPTKRRKKSKPKSDISEFCQSEPTVESGNDQIQAGQSKHQAIFPKYERSVKATENPIQDEASKDEPMSDEGPGNVTEFHGLEPLPQPVQVDDTPKVHASSFLPQWMQIPTVVSASDTISFKDLSLNPKTFSSLQKKEYEKASAIQSAVLPMLLPGPQHYVGDICIAAETGSGKTVSYVLPMVEALRSKPVTRLRGLIVVPTRELVAQVKETFDLCGGGGKLKVGTAVGNKSLREEQALLVQKGQKYDPEGYKAEQEKKVDPMDELMDWDFEKRFGPQDDFEILHNHVVEYTSKVDILICTPGRLVEHVQSTTGFTLEHVQWFVADEADRLLDESFQQWIDVVLPGLEYLPPLGPIEQRIHNSFHTLRRREIRKIILSATMTRDVSKLTALKLRRPRLVVLERQQNDEVSQRTADSANIEAGERIDLPATLHEVGVKVSDSNDKPLYLIRILEDAAETIPMITSKATPPESDDESTSSSDSLQSPTSSTTHAHDKNPKSATLATPHGTLIFTKTNEHATRLARLLSLLRPAWSPHLATLTKTSSSKSARKTLSAFRNSKLSILIASDRASRGLDIPHLAHVINYDMPASVTAYVHRVGRTARVGREGMATTLVGDAEAWWFWNRIARGEGLGRGVGRKVGRDNGGFVFGEGERKAYQVALEELGRETRG